jgi:hypothetical protein
MTDDEWIAEAAENADRWQGDDDDRSGEDAAEADTLVRFDVRPPVVPQQVGVHTGREAAVQVALEQLCKDAWPPEEHVDILVNPDQPDDERREIDSTDELRWQVADLMNEAEENGLDPEEVVETVLGYAKGRQTDR